MIYYKVYPAEITIISDPPLSRPIAAAPHHMMSWLPLSACLPLTRVVIRTLSLPFGPLTELRIAEQLWQH